MSWWSNQSHERESAHMEFRSRRSGPKKAERLRTSTTSRPPRSNRSANCAGSSKEAVLGAIPSLVALVDASKGGGDGDALALEMSGMSVSRVGIG